MSELTLVPLQPTDRPLYTQLYGSAQMMKYIGGQPWTPERIDEVFAKYIGSMAEDRAWMFKIVGADGEALGQIGLWNWVWDDRPITEIGSMIRSEYQVKGVVQKALELLLDWARAQGRFEEITAFSNPGNAASNWVAEKYGFRFQGVVERKLKDRIENMNHWVMRLK
jgi:RimJ/RimL family protein N-acetyltransferase